MLALMKQSGCQGVLIGFESLNPENLKVMNKGINLASDLYETSLANLHRHGIRVYGTFVFGYDHDSPDSFDEAVHFAQKHGFYLAGFNHLTPFPGTPLYSRLEREGKLLFDQWWLDESYGYNMLPMKTAGMTPQAVQDHCVRARKQFYGYPSMLRRGFHPVNRTDLRMFFSFFVMNHMHRAEVSLRNQYPLGHAGWKGRLLEATS